MNRTRALFLSSQHKDPEQQRFSPLFKLPFNRGKVTWCGDLNRFTRTSTGVPHISALALHRSLIASQVPTARSIGRSLDVDTLSNGIRWHYCSFLLIPSDGYLQNNHLDRLTFELAYFILDCPQKVQTTWTLTH